MKKILTMLLVTSAFLCSTFLSSCNNNNLEKDNTTTHKTSDSNSEINPLDTTDLTLLDWYYSNLSEEECDFLINLYKDFVDEYDTVCVACDVFYNLSDGFKEPLEVELHGDSQQFLAEEIKTVEYDNDYSLELLDEMLTVNEETAEIIKDYATLNYLIASFNYYNNPDLFITIDGNIVETYSLDYFSALEQFKTEYLDSLTDIKGKYFK